MEVAVTLQEFRKRRGALVGRVGFVPTMGYLHAGHMSLVERARGENDHVVMSIFVNPAQFGPGEDLEKYPRDLDRDLEMAKRAGVRLVLAPENTADVYPRGFDTYVHVEVLSRLWEGQKRPGHFRGVATVVAKLFNIVRPDVAYFGEKDFQQLQVIRRMTRDLDLGIEIVGCETVREPDGLAMSSRNTYLDPTARARAVALSRALGAARELVAGGTRDTGPILARMEAILKDNSLSIDYVTIVDPATLEPIDRLVGPARALIAVFVGRIRLIDNARLEPNT